MSEITYTCEIPAAHMQKIFGENDRYIQKLEKDLSVVVSDRNGELRITGEESKVKRCVDILTELQKASSLGGDIEEQKVDYALALSEEEQTEALGEIDKDLICHTINGKPIKPKTLGQKAYVDAIRKNMIVFGLGPAGTGKTYLAMAMAITAFKRDEVSRIILTRPAIEAGEKLGFLPGDLQSKVDPYLRPLYDALYQIMGAETFAKTWKGTDRSGAPCLYERTYPGQCLHYFRRSPEHHTGADENVFNPNRLRFQGHCDRRLFPEGSAEGCQIGTGCGTEGAEKHRRYCLLQSDQQGRGKTSSGTEDCQGLRGLRKPYGKTAGKSKVQDFKGWTQKIKRRNRFIL